MAGSGTDSDRLQIQDVSYGRLLEEDGTTRVVSPLSTVVTDPLTGESIPGTLEALTAAVDLEALVSLNLGPDYVPRVVPRNGVLVVSFTRNLNPSTIFPDVVDGAGALVSEGSVRVRFQNGRPVPVKLDVRNGNEVWIDAVIDEAVGFPPSPVDFGPTGEPRADAVGFLALSLDRLVIQSSDGELLRARDDRLGTAPTLPIGFNPGNQVLDFISQSELIPTNETFNGFLPDTTAPLLVRDYALDGKLDLARGDGADPGFVRIANAGFSESARRGAGEWSGELLVLRPGRADEESARILRNSRDTWFVASPFQQPLRDGEAYSIRRTEFFEPNPETPILESRFDPNNPQNAANRQFVNFVRAFEIDDEGNRVGGPIDLRAESLPAFSELAVTFNEPIDDRSLGQWENFRVARQPDDGTEKVSRIVLSQGQREVRIQPVRVEQDTGALEVVGWGPGKQNLQLILQTVPDVEFLLARMESVDVRSFLDGGARAITDLGGSPLGFPLSQFDRLSPVVQYQVNFFTDESLSSLEDPPVSRDWRMIVHRFPGRPDTGIDPNTEVPGVLYGDQPNVYGPVGDMNLQVNGFLAGQPVIFASKVLDDFFPPPDGQFGAFPEGTLVPLAAGNPDAPLPPNASSPVRRSHHGARFQHLYREVDASPGLSLAGTLLDLYRISFAPIGGNVTRDVYEDLSIHAAHSPLRPNTSQSGGASQRPNSGLQEPFDWESYLQDALSTVDSNVERACRSQITGEGPNVYEGSLVTCVPAGTSWTIQQKDLYTPPFDNRAYHPFPEFENPFPYNNGGYPDEHRKMRTDFNAMIGSNYWRELRNLSTEGDSLVLEYRIRPQRPALSLRNGFTFARGIQSDPKPNFRVFNIGTNNGDVALSGAIPNPVLDPDDIENDLRARCSNGYAPQYRSMPAQGGAEDFTGIQWSAAQGDNARHFMVFDYVKTTSTIVSPYVRGGVAPRYFPAFIDPPPQRQPAGTQVVVEYRGARNVRGGGPFQFSPDPADHSSRTHIAFRVTFVGNRETRLSPNFETLAIPVLEEG